MLERDGFARAVSCLAIAIILACAAIACFAAGRAAADQAESEPEPLEVEMLDGMPDWVEEAEGVESEPWQLSIEDYVIDFS